MKKKKKVKRKKWIPTEENIRKALSQEHKYEDFESVDDR